MPLSLIPFFLFSLFSLQYIFYCGYITPFITHICLVLYCLIYPFNSSFSSLSLLFIGTLDLSFNPIIPSSLNSFFHKYSTDRITFNLFFTYSNPHLSYNSNINVFSCTSFVLSYNTLNVLNAVIFPFPYNLFFCCFLNPLLTSFY